MSKRTNPVSFVALLLSAGCLSTGLALARPASRGATTNVSLHRTVIAAPEINGPSANIVAVGDTIIFPVYDGDISTPPTYMPTSLRPLGKVRIASHSLLYDLNDRSSFGGFDVKSNIGAAYLVTKSGDGSLNVLLSLPQFHESCVSCRTVHFFFRSIGTDI